jgi:hypothetical protein
MTMALKTGKPALWALSHRASAGAQLTLEPREILRLNPIPPGLRVLSGMAWITWKGEDIVLTLGQEIRFSPGGNQPVLSAVGQGTLTVEMLD